MFAAALKSVVALSGHRNGTAGAKADIALAGDDVSQPHYIRDACEIAVAGFL